MSANVKKWLNRGGLGAMVVGAVALVIGGGDMSAAQQTVAQVSTIAGAVIVFVRELFN